MATADVTILPTSSTPKTPGSQPEEVLSPELESSIDKIRKIESRYLKLCAQYYVYIQSGDIPESFVKKVFKYSNKIESYLKDKEVKDYYVNEISEDKVSEYIITKLSDLEIRSPLKRSAEPLTNQPAKKTKSEFHISSHGLPNLGSTCFANSVLQLLFHTPGTDEILNKKGTVETDPEVLSLEEKLKAAQENQPEMDRLKVLLKEEKKRASDRIEFRGCLKELKQEYSKTNPNLKIVERLLSLLWSSPILSPLHMRIQQEDAQEFLVLLSDILNVQTHPNFHLTTLSLRMNPATDKKTMAQEVKESVQLAIPKKSATLQGCFDHYLQIEKLERAEIAALTEDVDCTSKRLIFIGQPPESIQFGLKRFNDRNQKISTPIKGFEAPVNIPFCDADGKIIHQAAFQVDAVVCHDGRSPQGGHYTTFFKSNDGWLELSDRYERKHSHAEGLAIIEKNGYIVKAHRI